MARRFNPRRVKIHHSYTMDEAARALGAHKNTVRSWIKDKQLPLVCGRRPYLIQGRALREFLATEQAKQKHKCAPGQVYCTACRLPKNPAFGVVEYRPLTVVTGNLRGLCSDCGGLAHRIVSLQRLPAVRGDLEVTFTQAVEHLRQGITPCGNCDSEKEG